MNYELDDEIPIRELFRSLTDSGLRAPFEGFRSAYTESRRKFRTIRYESLLEVTNTVWLADALEGLDSHPPLKQQDLEIAVGAAFRPFSASTALLEGSLDVLEAASRRFKLGLVTNFTYAPVVRGLLDRLGIRKYFQAVAISHEVGYRKPHPRIFEAALLALSTPPSEAVMVGNDPLEDIAGAKRLGLGAILVTTSKYYEDQQRAVTPDAQPDVILGGIDELEPLLGDPAND